MANVAIYIRWSTEDQGQGTTLATQMESCTTYCAQQGWSVPAERIFVDDGHSGGTLYRPAMSRLRAAVAAGEIDTVVAYRMDRLSRSLADATSLVDKEWKGKAIVRSATEDVQPEKDEGWLNYSFRAAFADYERRVIRQRTYGGKLQRIREGTWVHGSVAPFGWKRTGTPGIFEIDEAAAQILRTFYWKVVHENMGGPALARWANEHGIPAPQGEGPWRSPNLLKLLKNPVYGGKLVFGRSRQLKKTKAEPGPWLARREPVVAVEADPTKMPTIIPHELWEEAQTCLRRRSEQYVSGRGVTHPRLLTGLVTCACGRKLTVKRAYYRCYVDFTISRCPASPAYINAAALEQQVEAAFLNHVLSIDVRERVITALAARKGTEAALLESQRNSLREQLAGLDRQLGFIDQQFLRQVITIAEARRFRAAVAGQRTGLEARLKETEARLAASAEEDASLEAQLAKVDRWDALDVLQKKDVLRQFIERIEAVRTKDSATIAVTIHWAVAGR